MRCLVGGCLVVVACGEPATEPVADASTVDTGGSASETDACLPAYAHCEVLWRYGEVGAEPVPSSRTVYDGCGLPVQIDALDAAATALQTTQMDYGADPVRLLQARVDGDAYARPDGVDDVVSTYDYAADGRLDVIDRTFTNGAPPCSFLYVYEGADAFPEQLDDGCASPPVRYTYLRRSDGAVETETRDAGMDGTVESTLVSTLDAEGRPVEQVDQDAAGRVQVRSFYTWEDDRMLRAVSDFGDDGVDDTVIDYTYDSAGRSLTILLSAPVYGLSWAYEAEWVCGA